MASGTLEHKEPPEKNPVKGFKTLNPKPWKRRKRHAPSLWRVGRAEVARTPPRVSGVSGSELDEIRALGFSGFGV